jgi:exodeoxyribonuclease V beta subunit
MSQPVPFNIMDAPLNGINMVEASAGTGKTWNIEALTVRLIAENWLYPGDILVVTFTEAATQELRERIYKRLIEVIRILKSPDEQTNDPFLLACREKYAPGIGSGSSRPVQTDLLHHLEQCKQRFDEAAISTIHGFCKTVLTEFSHLTRTDVDVTIETQGREALVDDAVDDFWRQYNAREATLHGGMLAPLLNGPLKREELRKGVNLLLKQHQVTMLYPDPPEGFGMPDGFTSWSGAGSSDGFYSSDGHGAQDVTPTSSGDSQSDGFSSPSGFSLASGVDSQRGFNPADGAGPREGLTPPPVVPLLNRLKALIDEIRYVWEDDREVIRKQLADTKISHAGLDKNFEGIEAQLFDFLSRPIEYDYLPKIHHPRKFTARYLREGTLTAKNTYRSDHPVHQRIEEAMEVAAYIPDLEQRRALEVIRELYKERCARDGVTTFDALLSDVADALRLDAVSEGGTGALHAGLRERYKAGLIDEFQDTDPVQFEIFRRMFIDNPDKDKLLYLIGDPKQAIYKFRGADLRTYLKARALVKQQFTLETNFRSSHNMVEGVNALFEGEYSFIDKELVFHEAVASASENPFVSAVDASDAGQDGNRLGLHFPKVGEAPFRNKGRATRAVVDWTTSHIARSLESALLEPKATGFALEPGQVRSLTAGDIAVLVSSHYQARMMKASLEGRGVPAVVGGDANIFSTDDARLMNLMLDVLVDPQRLGSIRTLLASRLVGMDVASLEALQQDDLRWSSMLEIFARSRDAALQRGVLAGLRLMQDALEIERCVISWSDGERRITNLRHLSELLYEEQRRGHRNLAGLAQWLRSRRADAAENTSGGNASDETQMRLESDENRVTIMTMHTSKGLQFPVVYAPFLWDGRQKGSGAALYYDGEKDGYVMDMMNSFSKRLAEARGLEESRALTGLQRQDAENMEDRVRLMYVAVTRSRFRCYVPHAMVVNSKSKGTNSAFVAMLLRDKAAGTVQWVDAGGFERARGADASDLISELLGKLDTSRFCMYKAVVDPFARYRAPISEGNLAERRLGDEALQRVRQHVFVQSYSSLKKRAESRDELPDEMSPDEMSPDEVDKQLYTTEPFVHPETKSDSRDARRHDIFGFPKGAHTGNLWHEIFERLDFSEADTNTAEMEGVVRESCEEYGFNFQQWGTVLMGMVQQVLHADLGGFCMADVPLNRTLREMEFHLPYDAMVLEEFMDWIHRQKPFNPKSGVPNESHPDNPLASSQRTDHPDNPLTNTEPTHSPDNPLTNTEPTHSPDNPLTNTRQSYSDSDLRARHYLKGFVDLIVEHQGKYYIIDYKSDHLGDSFKDYDKNSLYSHMHNSGYIMQYYFYSIALYLYLRQRHDNFDFDSLYGGVHYLFLRAAGSEGNSGIYFDRPDPHRIASFAERIQKDVIAGEIAQ